MLPMYYFILVVLAICFARTKQTARKGAGGGGKAPRKQLLPGKQRSQSASATSSTSVSTSTSTSTSTSDSASTDQYIDLTDIESPEDNQQQQHYTFSTRNLHLEKLTLHHQLSRDFNPFGSIQLRPPLSHEHLWSDDVVHCILSSSKYYPDHINPGQPPDDSLVRLPLLGVCSFISWEPHRFHYIKTSTTTSEWHHRDEATIGMIVELKECTWPQSHRPCHLLIDIANVVQFIGRSSKWRDDIIHFALYHHFRLASSLSPPIPSTLCQYPHCSHSTYHYSTDHPMYGLCLDHWNQLIDRHDKVLQTHPLPFHLEDALHRLSPPSTSSNTHSTSTPEFRRRDRRLICQLITGMTGKVDYSNDEALFQRLATHYTPSGGNYLKIYAISSSKKDKRKEFDKMMELVRDDVYRISFEDESRFFSSPLLVYFIPIMLHANGQGIFTIGGINCKLPGTIDVEDLGQHIVSIIHALPPIINCPIIIYLGSCAHNIRTFDSWHNAIQTLHPSAASQLYYIYFASNALTEQTYNMCRSFIDILMKYNNKTVETAFWDTAINQDYSDLSPRLRCPDGSVHMPHHQVCVSRDVIELYRQRLDMPVITPSAAAPLPTSPTTTSTSTTGAHTVSTTSTPSFGLMLPTTTPPIIATASSTSSSIARPSTSADATAPPSISTSPLQPSHDWRPVRKRLKPGKRAREERRAAKAAALSSSVATTTTSTATRFHPYSNSQY